MPRTLKDARLDTRAARLRMKARREPYWRSISQGLAVGYRKGAKGGTWIARYYDPDHGRSFQSLAPADDHADADGVAILSFAQAQERARQWFHRQVRRQAGLDPADAGPYTVKHALKDYLEWYARRGKSLANTRTAIQAHIEPALGEVRLDRLTTQTIRKWLDDLANSPARLRGKKGADKPRHRATPSDADAKRRRRATANRVLHILKAALNHAWRDGKVSTDDPWRRVRPFHDVDAPVIRYLSEADAVRLVNACNPEFRPLVQAALLTGCRYGELLALRSSDVNTDSGTLTIRTSKSGKARHIVLTDEGLQFFEGVTNGRSGETLIFTRSDGTPWGKSHQQRPLADACRVAKIRPAISFHVLRHTHGSTLAMKGVPLPVIAKQLGHADTRMTERHYAHLAPSYVAETIRAAFPTLGIVPSSNVKLLRA